MKIILFAFVLSAVSMAFAEQPCKSTVVGDLHIEHFQSKMYGTSMTVRVWLPPGYADASNEKQKYPTLYMLDGQNAFDECTAFHGEHELQIDEAVTKLIGERIQPMIVVGVDSTHRRDYEYAPYSSPVTDPRAPEPIGKRLPSFLAGELLPYVSKRYRVSDKPAHTGVGGASLGGAAALYVALNRPDLFGLALLLSKYPPWQRAIFAGHNLARARAGSGSHRCRHDGARLSGHRGMAYSTTTHTEKSRIGHCEDDGDIGVQS